MKMIDGALIQMMYRFKDNILQNHRLAFFPSPYLDEFQNNPEIYEDDEIFADIIMKNIVIFPLRFDYVANDEIFRELDHPRSHLTLGQYMNCRIPVTAPLTPFAFIDFILRHFYNTAYRKYSVDLTVFPERFPDTIADAERGIIHLHLPL